MLLQGRATEHSKNYVILLTYTGTKVWTTWPDLLHKATWPGFKPKNMTVGPRSSWTEPSMQRISSQVGLVGKKPNPWITHPVADLALICWWMVDQIYADPDRLSNAWWSHHNEWTIVREACVPGEHKKSSPPATFVDISAVSANFCMKFYVIVKQSNIHFITKFGWNL